MSVNKPTVFNVTVFPPVFGPVITMLGYSPPSSISFATTSSAAING
jgi:hypothetical protein